MSLSSSSQSTGFPLPSNERLAAPKAGAFLENASGKEMEPWRRCYREVGAKLLLYARQILQSDQFTVGQEAEDVVQTAFVRFWRQHPNAQPEQYGLLFAAVRTAALDALRSSLRRARREESYSLDILDFRDSATVQGRRESWFETSDDHKLRADRVQQALSNIPAEQREVIVMKVWGDLTFAQIADSLKESPNTVAARYRLGMNALKRKLNAGGQDEP